MGNPEEAESHTSEYTSSAPPPYSEAVQGSHREASRSTNGDRHTSTNATRISPYRPFPPILSAHYQWKMITPVFHLGDPTDKRLFAVKVHTGYGGYGPGRPGVVLHNGPTDKYPMLAAAGDEHYANSYSLNGIITLPSLSGGTTADGNCTEILRAATSPDAVVFRFSIEVGPGQDLWREDFEWRKSKGCEEDKGLVGAPWKCGFKLFRLSPRSGKDLDPDPANGTLQKSAPKNQELVAVFAWSSNLNLMDPFKIEFRGSGRTGVLGERFALMTVITGLRLWGLKAQRRTSESKIAAGEARCVPGTSSR
ncbi:uncharacterized protein F4812DRAFT_91938 [Daldinia caldariorum]|uniref:uncharacterized protein n=1 Tax=Daldinia caldariorum TaxID=326644 RepID=UPI0020088D3F|nr:uncharacterized protein F4812DRAFT_91938 [Daldinia caldariorum]KAI1465990.1 hypothetical protein F4812DRAFT_91938 [Daldinia caldariorum]